MIIISICLASALIGSFLLLLQSTLQGSEKPYEEIKKTVSIEEVKAGLNKAENVAVRRCAMRLMMMHQEAKRGCVIKNHRDLI